MRRNNQVTGNAGGGFNKPPPVPVTHSAQGRIRFHPPEVSSHINKERSPRERSPGLVGAVPISPSHPSSREKSPNPSTQDLHDCSMCLSAYIQSLNTVCGTACRLSLCLAQAASDSCSFSNESVPLLTAKEAAESWESIARAVGIASAAVKTQMLLMLQELQSHHVEFDPARRAETARVVHALLFYFLNLHFQFSAVVIDRFSGLLNILRDDSIIPSFNMNYPQTSFNAAGVGDASYNNSSAQYSSQHNLQSCNAPSLSVWSGGSLSNNCKGIVQMELPPKEESLKGKTTPLPLNMKAGGPNVGIVNPCSPHGMQSTSSSSHNPNMLSPGFCYQLFPQFQTGQNSGLLGFSSDAISRRWSMGSGLGNGSMDRTVSYGPFSLINSRRWSVPETTEHDFILNKDPSNQVFMKHPVNGSKGSLQLPSRDSSITRSPSHSRSVTPDPLRSTMFLSSEELQDVIELLSFPLLSDSQNCQVMGPASQQQQQLIGRIAEETSREFEVKSDESSTVKGSNKHEGSENLKFTFNVDPSLCLKDSESSGQCENDCPQSRPGDSPRQQMDGLLLQCQSEECPVITPLWPPTGSVPGVTLTECSAPKELIQPWIDNVKSEHQRFSAHNRSASDNTSWTALSNSPWATVDSSEAEEDLGRPVCSNSFRRHSSDTPFLLSNSGTSLGEKTKSSDNLSMTGCLDSDLNQLLYLNSLLPSSSPPSPTSHYSLFTHNA